MGRYDWPRVTREEGEGDDPIARDRFTRRSKTDFDPVGARAASLAARVPRPHPDAPGPFAPPSGRAHLWQPLGPMTVVHSDVVGEPRVTGRVKMLAVHSDGERVYAASANGGVWYRNDSDGTWKSLGGFAPTPANQVDRPIQPHACGAIAVSFGSSEAADKVFVGTGDPMLPVDVQPPSSFGGLGILFAEGPATIDGANPWTREATAILRGHGVSRIAIQPGSGTTGVVAATTIGLLQRPVPLGDREWVRVAGEPFSSLTDPCSDVLWTKGEGARPERLWVWVWNGTNAGLWVHAAGETNFAKVATPGSRPNRAVLAAAEPPNQIFVFCNNGSDANPLLFRVACATAAAPVATVVTGVPDVLGKQGDYDIALTVHPTMPNRIVVGGSTFDARSGDGFPIGDQAAVLTADIGEFEGELFFGLPLRKMIGVGVHVDVHDLAFSNSGSRLWLAGDGGVFRSDHPDEAVGFFPVNDGLSVVESNYLANHPTCEGYVVAGLQDNGVIGRCSTGVWKHEGIGDAGGVVFDPIRPSRYLRQYSRSKWGPSVSLDVFPFIGEMAAVYSMPAGIGHRRGVPAEAPPNVGQVILGTRRVWYTQDFGANWFTLPAGVPPPAGNTDDFGGEILVCRWQSPDVAWILSEGILKRYAREPGTDSDQHHGTWSVQTIVPTSVTVGMTQESVRKKRRKRRQQQPPNPPSAVDLMQDSDVWTDVAMNLDAGSMPRGTLGAVYLGTIGHPTDDTVDTLWWFDGTSTWYATGLRNHGVAAPVLAITCDPEDPEEVWVGTTVGVWRGVRNQIGNNPPTWTWEARVNGLPEAAVEDLAIFNNGGLRLLRAAISARGMWELRLDVADLTDLTYVRAHDDDLRYRARAVEKRRDQVTDRSWHGSPDVRPRRAPLPSPAPASLPWFSLNFDPEPLRRFQCALRARTGDPRVRPSGKWDAYFSELLRELGAPTTSLPAFPNTVCIDAAFWNLSMVEPHHKAEAWGAAGAPTEADLHDFCNHLTEGDLAEASCEMPPEELKVDVVVHHRGLDAIDDGDTVRVTLLQWIDPKTKNRAKWDAPATWFSGPVPWTAAVNEVLNSADGKTSLAPGDGWAFVFTDENTGSHRKTLAGQTLDSMRSGIATFDINVIDAKKNLVVLLVAVIRAGASPSALAPATVQDLALTSPSVAVRSMRVNPK